MKGYAIALTTIEVLDAGRRGATTEAYGTIRRKEERSLARLRLEGNAADDALMADQGGSARLYNRDLGEYCKKRS